MGRAVDDNGIPYVDVVNPGAGGGGDASAANQTTEIGLLTTIDADTGNIATSTATAATQTTNAASGIGGTADAIVAAGAAGSLSAKLRRVTQGLEDLKAGITAIALPTGASTSANQSTEITALGGVTETPPANDTASSGLNGRLQRIAQRLSSIIALIPAALGSNGGFKVELASALSSALDSITLGAFAGVGATPFQNLDVDESEDAVSTNPCTLYTLVATNVSAGTRYLKLYNDTVANVVVGTTTPLQTYALPAGAGMVLQSPVGLKFSVALTIAATTGVAVADTGAPGANDVVVSGSYA